jgi:hypothetical protein
MSGRMRLAGVSLLAAAGLASSPLSTAEAVSSNNGGRALYQRIVLSQNLERERVGLSNMAWDPSLAVDAANYASYLAATDEWHHSSWESRVGQGENLWMGTHNAFTPREMVNGWLDERRLFHSGTFPNVSKSGSWHDVGHYTQLIWPGTDRVGCAVRASADWDYLVCRYSGPGNVMGDPVGPAAVAMAHQQTKSTSA